jgi:hypothetical protein
MGTETTFRDTLICELESLVNSRELDEQTVQLTYVENKWDLLGEFLDFYTDELLAFDPFTEEFTRPETRELEGLLRTFRESRQLNTRWSEICRQAADLVKQLQHEGE